MNFFDLCVACWHALGRFCAWCWSVLSRMLRLTYRYWWLVITMIILALAAGYYYTRFDNRTFRVNAVALLNGPTIQQFEEVYAPMRALHSLAAEAPIAPFIREGKVSNFDTYRVIDALHDQHADFIDFKRKTKPTDTVNVQMQDRICIQFRMKARNMVHLQEVEHALMATINADPVLQKAYETYLVNLREEVAFNHRQAQKLDSLTSSYYYYNASAAQPMNYSGNGVNFYGDRRIRLFLNDIYKQHEHMQMVDQRMLLATAPVTLESHFAVDPKPVMGRMKCMALMFLLSWCFGCLLAELIDRRKAIMAWLKSEK